MTYLQSASLKQKNSQNSRLTTHHNNYTNYTNYIIPGAHIPPLLRVFFLGRFFFKGLFIAPEKRYDWSTGEITISQPTKPSMNSKAPAMRRESAGWGGDMLKRKWSMNDGFLWLNVGKYSPSLPVIPCEDRCLNP